MTQENYEVQIINQEITDFDLNFKIIIIGDSGVGKSCLSLRATKNVFENLYSPTIGFEFMTFFIKVDNKAIKLQIWDTCGQEIYRSLISSFYNSSSLAIVVYSIDNEDSFNNLDFWWNEIRSKANPEIGIILIGNKADLDNKRKVTKETAQEYCDNNQIKVFMETSAKTGDNAQNIFIEAAKMLYEQHMKSLDRPSRPESLTSLVSRESNQSTNLNIMTSDPEEKPRKKRCCKWLFNAE